MNPTQEQINAVRQQAGFAPLSSVSNKSVQTPSLAEKYGWAPTETQAESKPFGFGSKVADEMASGGQKIIDSVEQGGNMIKQGLNPTNPEDVLKIPMGITKAGAGSVVGAGQVIAAPITAGIKSATDKIVELMNKNYDPYKESIDTLVKSPEIVNKFNEIVSKNPEASGVIGDTLGAVLEFFGAKGMDVNQVLKSPISKATGEVSGVTKPFPLSAKPIDSKVIEPTVGRVLQGAPEDIASGKSGLGILDTSEVKTYSDLKNVAKSKIDELSSAQDELLSTDKTPRKLGDLNSNLKVKIDGVEKDIQHNFVQDGLDQLKNYYTSVNDVKNLEKVKNYIEKGGEKGAGLTIKDVNDIARMHSSDLNAFNASGELASGLKKQAAENTRIGMKKTVRELGPKGSEVIDKKITDVYTVKDLSGKMEDAVNKLSQRLQNPNIFRKLGGLVGKATRVTGIGDFASKLLGIDKMPGANILSPVELEAQLSKNLKKINAALGKDDAGFINDMQEFSKELKSSI